MAGNRNSGRRAHRDLSKRIVELGQTQASVMVHLASISDAVRAGHIETKRAEVLEKLARAQLRALSGTEIANLKQMLTEARELFERGLANQARDRHHVAGAPANGEQWDG